MINRMALWLDNPILMKHARSRLRQMQWISSISVVMILALVIVMFGYQFGLNGGQSFGWLMLLQVVILGFMGASQVGSSVSKARELGILDFHRVSPMPPLSLALGFFFGAPIREYVMFAATLPFSVFCVINDRPTPAGFFQLMVPLVLSAWVLHAIALLNALAGNKGGKSGSRGVIGLVMFLIFGGTFMASGFIKAADAVAETPLGQFYGIKLPWLLILAIYLFPVISFLLTAATRKMASERAHGLSKAQAVGCLATGAFLILGGLWANETQSPWTLIVLYSLIVGSIVMTSTITPNLDEFAKGVRKAVKEGRRFPAVWSDRGLNRISLFCLCGIILVASTACWRLIEVEKAQNLYATMNRPMTYSLPIAISVLVVAYYGLALQFFQLRFPKRGTIFFALFLFGIWLLPLAFGAISAAAVSRRRAPGDAEDIWSPAIASLSPIMGIAISSGTYTGSGVNEIRAAALTPALVFALLFNNLVTSTRRRIEKQIHPDRSPDPQRPKPQQPKPNVDFDQLDEPIILN